MLLMELLCFASIFIAGIIILIAKQNYSLCISCLGTAAFFFPPCYFNEKILDKLAEVPEALYDLPWHCMTIKERRTLLVALNCTYVTGGYHAADIHDLSLERFSTVVRAAYSNCLVLKDLIVAFN